jgi:hypothetical protein
VDLNAPNLCRNITADAGHSPPSAQLAFAMSSALPFREVSDADAILNFIFDKNKSFIGAAPSVESARPAAPAAPPSASDPEWQDHLRGTETETAAITAAEGGDFRSAQTLLDKLCADMPERASAFNNRAQLRRLQKDAAGSMTDLDTAIACGERWLKAHPEDAGSGCAVARTKLRAFHRQVLQQAYTQRAICHRCGVRACRERGVSGGSRALCTIAVAPRERPMQSRFGKARQR